MRRRSKNKNSTKIFIAATIVAALAFGASNYLLRDKNNVVIATVNNQNIYQSDINSKLRSVFDGQNIGQSQGVKIPEIATLPQEVIKILAKEVYLDQQLVQKAKKSSLVDSSETKNKIKKSKNKILRQAYIDATIKQEITDQKINDKYIELSNELAGKKEYLISHIVTTDKKTIKKALREFKSKRSITFAFIAKKYSIDQDSAAKGGELGYVLEDNIMKEIADAIPNLKKNKISKPIQTKFGWHLIKISNTRDAKALPFENVKDNIRDQLYQDALNEINSKITKDAEIEILIPLKDLSKPEELTIQTTDEKLPEEKAQKDDKK